MTNPVNSTNSWGQWSNDLNEGTTLIQDVNQNVSNMDNAATYAQFMDAYQACYSQVSADYNLIDNPYYAQFCSGLQTALSETLDQVKVIDPSTNQLVSVSTLNSNLSVTINPNLTWLQNNTTYSWIPGLNQSGMANGSSMPLGSFLDALLIFGSSGSFTYNLPNGDLVTLNVIAGNNGNLTMTINAPYQDLAPNLQMPPNPNLANPVQNFMNSLK